MTAINIYLKDNRCFLTTDTLAGNREGTKSRNVNKVYPMPGYHSILIGTGDGRHVFNWYSRINQRGSMQNLHQGTEIFPSMIRDVAEENGIDQSIKTDILHISYDQVATVDLYSSVNNFDVEDVSKYYFSPKFTDESDIVKELNKYTHKAIKKKLIQLAVRQQRHKPNTIGGFCVYIEANANKNHCEISSNLLFDDIVMVNK